MATETATPASPTETLVVLRSFSDPAGGRWNTGDRAGFSPDVARTLIARELARPLTDKERADRDQRIKAAKDIKSGPHKMETGDLTK